MIKYWPNSIKAFTADDVFHKTRAVSINASQSPGDLVAAHMNVIMDPNALAAANRNRGIAGKVFEYVLRDCFIQALPQLRNDDLAMGVHLPLSAELDLAKKPWGVFSKTSFRERWKQVDRDAQVARAHDYSNLFALFWRENVGDPVEKSVALASRLQGKFFSDHLRVGCARDNTFMLVVINALENSLVL